MDVEAQVQKHLVSFCKSLPGHVDLWTSALQDSAKPLEALTNFCEQRHCAVLANLDSLEDINYSKTVLLSEISNRIEEELLNLKEIIDRLNKSNNDLKNKLLVFERSTLNLDWELNSELIKGSGSQPSLSRVLQSGLEFLNFFLRNAKNISDRFKELNLEDEKFVKEFQSAFDVNLNDKAVITLIALTQYVDNAKAIL